MATKDYISFDGQVFSTKKEMNNHETNFTRHRLITHYMDPTCSLKMNKNTYLQDLVNQIRNHRVRLYKRKRFFNLFNQCQ